MYDGRTELKQGTVVGHEILRVIEEIGQAVQRKGDGRATVQYCLWLLVQLSSRLHQRMLDHETVNPAALENALRVVNPTGSVGVIGVYIAPDSGAKDEQPTGDLLVPSS